MVKKINSSVVALFLFLYALLYFSVHTFLSVHTEGFRADSFDRWNRIANHFWWFLRFFSLSMLSIFINSVCALDFCFGQPFIWWFSSFDYLSIPIGVYKWTSTKMAAFEIVLAPCSPTSVVFFFFSNKFRHARLEVFNSQWEQIGNLLERFSFSVRKVATKCVSSSVSRPTEKSTV